MNAAHPIALESLFAVAEATAAGMTPGRHVEPEGHTQTPVLVVDDREDRRLAMFAVLEELQQRVVLADSGIDALRHLLREDFSLILLDINMPDMDGLELAQMIRSRKRTAKTPIIFYTSDAETARQRQPEAYRLGAVDLLTGPVSADVLRSKVSVFTDFHNRLADARRTAGERERMLRAEAAQAEAERASAAKDRFLAMLSHELRTPLSPVINTIELLLETTNHAPELRDHLEMIRRNVVLEARLIDDLLDLTKVSRGKVALRFEPVDAHEAIQNALHICEPEMRTKHITAKVTRTAGRPLLQADSARLKQILWNLIRNAVKFSEPRGEIFITTRDSGQGHLCIEVRDTGCGIHAELLPNIFEAFRQGLHNTGGLGLGLAITHSLVALHEGAINAQSDGPGKGATFTVCLPFAEAAESGAGVSETPGTEPEASNAGTAAGASARASSHTTTGVGSPAPAGTRRTGKLLLVEDHEDTRNTLVRLLTRRGYVVTEAYSVASALETTRSQDFDVIISDIGLPDGTGCDFISRVPEAMRLRSIALSGFGMEEDLRRSLTAGFTQHLIKPVIFDELDGVIQGLLVG